MIIQHAALIICTVYVTCSIIFSSLSKKDNWHILKSIIQLLWTVGSKNVILKLPVVSSTTH